VASVALGQQKEAASVNPTMLATPKTLTTHPVQFAGYVTPTSVKINGVAVPFQMSPGATDSDVISWSAIGPTAAAGPQALLGVSVLEDVAFAAPNNNGNQKLEGIQFSFATAATVSNPLGAITVAFTWFNSMDQSAGATSVASNPNVGIQIALNAPTGGWVSGAAYTLNGFTQWFAQPLTVGAAGGLEMAVLDATGTTLNNDFLPALSVDPVSPGTSNNGVWADQDHNGIYTPAEAVVLVDQTQAPLPTALRVAVELQPVDPNTGACCLANGSCVALVSADCTSQAGAVFRGAGSKCGATNPTCFNAGVLWDNGPLATGAVSASGTAAPTGGLWSEPPFSGNCVFITAGVSANSVQNLRLADDFTVPAGQTWTISDVSVFSYQTNSVTTASPISGATLQIWNGRPAAAGSSVIFGDTTTNRLSTTTLTNWFRVLGSSMIPNNTPTSNRAIWKLQMNTPGLMLSGGHYYIDYSTTAANAGTHFTPLVAVMTNNVGVLDINNGNLIQFDPTTVGGGFDGWFELGEDGNGINMQTGCLAHALESAFVIRGTATTGLTCYPNCDHSTAIPFLNVLDFTCFLQRFAAADPYANCDNSTQPPVLNVLDFTCFLQKFAAGCSAP
jgi:hypothetical protein